MANPFKFFSRQLSPSYLGVDIGTTSVKMVEVRQGKQLPELVNYGFLESTGHLLRSNDVLQTSSLKLFESEAVKLLKTLVARMKPQTDEAFASLPPFSAFMTVLDFPEMSSKDTEKAIAIQAGQYIPLPVAETRLDWIRVGTFEDDKGFKHQQVLLISVSNEEVRKYERIFQSAGLTLKGLELESLALVRALAGTDPTPSVIVDIGSRSTSVVFVEKGELRFNVQSDFSGASLTQALVSSLNINPIRAEELKKERGIVGTGPNYELSTIMLPFLDVIINEIKKAQFTYQNQFPNALKVERIILSGGTANLAGVVKYFEKEFGLPVVKASPLSRFEYPASVEPLVGELNPLLSVALGLAERAFV